MTFPTKPLPTGTVTVNGTEAPIRGLSFAETRRMVAFEDDPGDAADVLVLSAGTGMSEDEARAWFASNDPITANEVLLAILRLTGLASADPRSGSIGDGPAERPSNEP